MLEKKIYHIWVVDDLFIEREKTKTTIEALLDEFILFSSLKNIVGYKVHCKEFHTATDEITRIINDENSRIKTSTISIPVAIFLDLQGNNKGDGSSFISNIIYDKEGKKRNSNIFNKNYIESKIIFHSSVSELETQTILDHQIFIDNILPKGYDNYRFFEVLAKVIFKNNTDLRFAAVKFMNSELQSNSTKKGFAVAWLRVNDANDNIDNIRDIKFIEDGKIHLTNRKEPIKIKTQIGDFVYRNKEDENGNFTKKRAGKLANYSVILYYETNKELGIFTLEKLNEIIDEAIISTKNIENISNDMSIKFFARFRGCIVNLLKVTSVKVEGDKLEIAFGSQTDKQTKYRITYPSIKEKKNLQEAANKINEYRHFIQKKYNELYPLG